MALIQCKECNNTYSSLVNSCPKCGAPTAYSTGAMQTQQQVPPPQPQYVYIQQQEFRPREVGVLLFFGIFLMPYIFVWFLFRKGYSAFARTVGLFWLVFVVVVILIPSRNKDNTNTTTPAYEQSSSVETIAPLPEEALAEFSASEIFDAYHRNEVAADDQFKHKVFIVYGQLDGISKDFTDDVVLTLTTSNMFLNLHAFLVESDFPAAARLEKGQSIRLKCSGAGMTLGTPVVRDCHILSAKKAKKPAKTESVYVPPVEAEPAYSPYDAEYPKEETPSDQAMLDAMPNEPEPQPQPMF